jgi:hypothetical protein
MRHVHVRSKNRQCQIVFFVGLKWRQEKSGEGLCLTIHFLTDSVGQDKELLGRVNKNNNAAEALAASAALLCLTHS